MDEVCREIEGLTEKGYCEFVLTGIHVASYGRNSDDDLITLLQMVSDIEGVARIRLSSLEPLAFTDEFISALTKMPKVCPHFHLSLQSGCDATLRRMGRKYGTARVLESCRLLREAFPDCAVTTDLIVGFPGETEEEFSATLAFLRQAGFAAMHIFPYSRRTGTPAAKMPGQIPNAEKERRAARAGAVERELRTAYREGFVGKRLPVLFEQQDDQGRWTGHAPNYIPVAAEGMDLRNQIRDVEITGQEEQGLLGKLI